MDVVGNILSRIISFNDPGHSNVAALMIFRTSDFAVSENLISLPDQYESQRSSGASGVRTKHAKVAGTCNGPSDPNCDGIGGGVIERNIIQQVPEAISSGDQNLTVRFNRIEEVLSPVRLSNQGGPRLMSDTDVRLNSIIAGSSGDAAYCIAVLNREVYHSQIPNGQTAQQLGPVRFEGNICQASQDSITRGSNIIDYGRYDSDDILSTVANAYPPVIDTNVYVSNGYRLLFGFFQRGGQFGYSCSVDQWTDPASDCKGPFPLAFDSEGLFLESLVLDDTGCPTSEASALQPLLAHSGHCADSPDRWTNYQPAPESLEIDYSLLSVVNAEELGCNGDLIDFNIRAVGDDRHYTAATFSLTDAAASKEIQYLCSEPLQAEEAIDESTIEFNQTALDQLSVMGECPDNADYCQIRGWRNGSASVVIAEGNVTTLSGFLDIDNSAEFYLVTQRYWVDGVVHALPSRVFDIAELQPALSVEDIADNELRFIALFPKEAEFSQLREWANFSSRLVLEGHATRLQGTLLLDDSDAITSVSYTHLTLPTKRIV